MSSAALAHIISAASAELDRRAEAGLPVTTPDQPQHAPVPKITDKPEEDDADFVLYVKSKLQGGGYITADERHRVAEIAQMHGGWVRRQGMPIENNACAWRNAGEYLSRPRAAAK